jgi:hypothetical protein
MGIRLDLIIRGIWEIRPGIKSTLPATTASLVTQVEKNVLRRYLCQSRFFNERVSPWLVSWINSRSFVFERPESMRHFISVRGSATPLPRKIVIPGLIRARTSSGETTRFSH